MNAWRLKNRIITLSLIPSMFLSTVTAIIFLSIYFNHLKSSAADTRDLISHKHVQTLRAHWKESLPPDDDLLQSVSHKIMQQQQVISVDIFDHQKQAIAHLGKEQEKTSSSRYIINSKAIYPLQSDYSNQQAPLGWIQIRFDTIEQTLKKYMALFYCFTVLAFTFLLVIYSTNRTSEMFVKPIRQLIAALDKLDITEPRINTEKVKFKEIQELTAGIVNFISRINKDHKELTFHVEQAAEDLQETLETIEIQNAELHLARKEAVETNQIKSEFLANMSHEIRTPLNSILGFTKLLGKSGINSQQRDYVHTITKSSNSLLALINDILDLSKIEAGHLVLEQVPVDLEEVIEDVIAMLAPLANEKQLELSCLVYSDVPTHIISDPLRLQQIITNLVGNAIKFTESGSIVLRVILEDSNESSSLIRIAVTDTGIGLDKGSQKNLFNAFQRSNNMANHRGDSTGLGLAICKKLITLMRGDIGIDSSQGRGSTFWINFRCHTDHFPAAKSYQIDQPQQVFIFDESSTDKLATRHLIEKWGFNASLIHSQHQWLEHLKNASSTDTFIYGLSHSAPSLNPKIINILRDNSQNSRARVIICGYDLVPLKQQPLESSTNILVSKPIIREKLYQAISNIGSQSYAEPVATTSPSIKTSHCLVVDDVADNLKLVTILLTELGHKVSQSSSAKEALRLCEQTTFDIIFMDIQMPIMDGTEAIKKIRSHCLNNAGTPIVALTAHSLADERLRSLALGASDYISKPVTEQHLQFMLRKWGNLPLHEGAEDEATLKAESYNQKIFDPHTALTVVSGKNSLARDFTQGLLNEIETKQPVLIDSLQQQQWPLLQEQVHKLNGLCRYTGANQLKVSIQTLENCLKMSNKISEITENFNQFERDAQALQQWFNNNDINELFPQEMAVPQAT